MSKEEFVAAILKSLSGRYNITKQSITTQVAINSDISIDIVTHLLTLKKVRQKQAKIENESKQALKKKINKAKKKEEEAYAVTRAEASGKDNGRGIEGSGRGNALGNGRGGSDGFGREGVTMP